MKLKRITSALTAIACTAGMLAVFPKVADVTYAAEAVRNDFEVTYEGWHGSTVDVDVTAAEGSGFAGSRGMIVSNRTTPSDGAASSIQRNRRNFPSLTSLHRREDKRGNYS